MAGSAGLSKLRGAQEERRARAAASGGGGNFFRVPEDGEEQIRILEDIETILTQSAYFHELEPLKPKRPKRLEICLDQDEDGNRIGADCPGCELNAEDYEVARRKLVMYANVLWRNGPVRKKNEKTNKYEDTDEKKDQLAVWEVRQVTIQDALEQAHLTYKDLTTRDFVIKRRGTGFDTTYTLNPATNDEGDAVKTPLTKADKELVEKKPDLTTRIAMKDADDWGKVKKAKSEAPDDEDEEEGEESPFLKRNNAKKDEE